MSHSVSSHLRVEIDAYDEAIRTFIPGYDEMLALTASTIAASGPAHVLDLGAGTGALSQAVLDRCGSCCVTLIDVDPAMLNQARQRLASYGSRTRFLNRSFFDPLPDCNAVVASLALHHVPSIKEKRSLYRAIRGALSPGGVFVNADVTMPAESDERRPADYETWAAHLTDCGIAEDRAWEHFREWADEDFYFPVEEELSALEAAGLAAECLWRMTPSTVMKGVRPRVDGP